MEAVVTSSSNVIMSHNVITLAKPNQMELFPSKAQVRAVISRAGDMFANVTVSAVAMYVTLWRCRGRGWLPRSHKVESRREHVSAPQMPSGGDCSPRVLCCRARTLVLPMREVAMLFVTVRGELLVVLGLAT